MENVDNVLSELENPPSKNNITIWSIIQILIMLFIGCEAGKDLFDLFKFGSFSIIDLIKIIVDLLIFVGFLIACYAFFKDDEASFKTGYSLFLFGLMGLLILYVLDWFRKGFSFGSLIEIIIYSIIIYIILRQLKKL